MSILIVEDEPKTVSYLKKGLKEAGFNVEVAKDGEQGIELARKNTPDLLILDVMLPKKDGWEVITDLRNGNLNMPVIFLTAKDPVEDRVRGLELGADDYLVKPFAFSELLARIRTLLRRRSEEFSVNNPLRVSDLKVDPIRQKVWRNGETIDLSQKEFQLLLLFLRHIGEVLPRNMIIEKIWDMHFDPGTNVVDVAVRRLRSKVDEPFESKLIHTVRGVGYVLEEQ